MTNCREICVMDVYSLVIQYLFVQRLVVHFREVGRGP